MGLFLKRRSEYQGFARYADEYRNTPPLQYHASGRSQSLAGASQAAAAALQLHSKPAGLQPPHSTARRTSSLSSAGRHNSMRSYTYNPKPSYHAGPQPPPAGAAMRSNSMGLRLFSRAGAQNAAGFRQAPYLGPQEELQDEDSVVVTTKTTKVVDAFGRTTSITLETIRKLADGSNIIETKTTNISRPTSRNNSFRANSLSQGPQAAAYNLDKIDEDLQDFDYTYLDHEDASPPRLNYTEKAVSSSPKTDRYLQEQRQALLGTSLPQNQSGPGSSAVGAQSTRLKSILKASPHAPLAEDASGEMHSYNPQSSAKRLDPSPNLKSAQFSNASRTNSIKFHETVETISYPSEQHNVAVLQKEKLAQEEEEKKKNVDLYAQAMKVAMQKVYGATPDGSSQTPPASPATKSNASPASEVGDLAAKKIKKDHKREHVELGGVSRNYIYENHHKDFAARSLRGTTTADASTRKKRVKEEMKEHKNEEKRQQELLKNAQKEQKKQEKAAKKEKKKRHLSLFGRSKRKNSIDGSVFSTVALDANASVSLPDDADGKTNQPAVDVSDDQTHQIATDHKQHPAVHSAPDRAASGGVESSDRVASGTVESSDDDDDDTREHFVDVPDVIDEDEELYARSKPAILNEGQQSVIQQTGPSEGEAAPIEEPTLANSPGDKVHVFRADEQDEVLYTLVSSSTGQPQVLTDTHPNADPGPENYTPSPNLESDTDVVEGDARSRPMHLELDSVNLKSPKKRNRETGVILPGRATSADSPNTHPQILLFEPQDLSEGDLHEESYREAPRSGQRGLVSLPTTLSTVEPSLARFEDEQCGPKESEGEKLSSPFVPNGKQEFDEHGESVDGQRESLERQYVAQFSAGVDGSVHNDAPARGAHESTGGGNTDAEVSVVTAADEVSDRVQVDSKGREKVAGTKKPSKFRKIIDKYFVNNYSR